jgi:glycosyltransferase involved in cell wall biosynthesis
MNLLFVNYHDFRGNSAIHIANLANELARQGFSCSVAVPRKARRTARLFKGRQFQALSYRHARRGRYGFPNDVAPDLIHAWTPREGVRDLVASLHARNTIPYIVHLEDNEDVIAADQLGIARDQLRDASDSDIERRLIPTISHPRRYREFIAAATGATVIVDRLAEFVPAGVPTHVLWPAFEASLFKPRARPVALARSLGLHEKDRIVVYAGTVHPTNAEEVRELYLAVAALDTEERPVRLVRLGSDFLDFLGEDAGHARRIEIRVPHQPREEVASFYALADVLVQPGAPGAFNDYRVPSKLPEYFAMGIPVILPRSNLGLLARDGEECLLLDDGSASDIAAKLGTVLDDPALARRLANGGRRFAERTFSWERSARDLSAFYDAVLERS